MTDGFKAEIRSRAGFGATGSLYRGGDFSYPIIEADVIDVFYVSNTEEEVDDARATDPTDSLNIVRQETERIAGGLSSRVRGSMKFAQELSRLSEVLVFDPNRISPRPQPIEYDLEWMDKNPGLLARIDTLSNGEIRSVEDGRLLGLTWEDGIVHKGKRVNLEHTATTPTYETEQEWFVNAPELDLTGSLIGGITVAHQQKAVGGSIQGALSELEGFSMGGFGRNRSVTTMSREEQARELHGFVRAQSGPLLTEEKPLWLVVVDDDRNWESNGGIDPDEFVLATDGDRTVREADRLPEWVPV